LGVRCVVFWVYIVFSFFCEVVCNRFRHCWIPSVVISKKIDSTINTTDTRYSSMREGEMIDANSCDLRVRARERWLHISSPWNQLGREEEEGGDHWSVLGRSRVAFATIDCCTKYTVSNIIAASYDSFLLFFHLFS
jgi:hypothetical protein